MDAPAEVGACYRVVAPRGRETPVVVEVPHAGLGVDATSVAQMAMPARCLARDADLHVDALVAEVPSEGATLLVANVSRFVVDLNRGEDDHDAFAVEGSPGDGAPHGVVWHRATAGERVLTSPVTRAELARRLDAYHRPYHRALAALLADKKQRFGYAILLSAHSMPSIGVGAGGRSVARADLVPGTRGKTTAALELIDHVEREARAHGLSVRHDDPYRGGFVTRNYGKPARGVHAIQLEIARRLYMSEETLCTIDRGVTTMRVFYGALARSIAQVPMTTKAASART